MMISKSNEPTDYIWIVEGSSGAYSDHCSWVVCAYKTEQEAKYHAERAQARSEELERKYDHYFQIPAKANEWDEQELHDYTGTRYIISMIEIKRLDLQK